MAQETANLECPQIERLPENFGLISLRVALVPGDQCDGADGLGIAPGEGAADGMLLVAFLSQR